MKPLRQVSRLKSVDIAPTPEEVAALFWGMNSDEQIAFFNALAEVGAKLDMQLAYVIDDATLTAEGRGVMQTFGCYGAAREVEEAREDAACYSLPPAPAVAPTVPA